MTYKLGIHVRFRQCGVAIGECGTILQTVKKVSEKTCKVVVPISNLHLIPLLSMHDVHFKCI
jgi:hypothetical protein